MGFLKVGEPLTWKEVEKVKSLIRFYGILQFVHTHNCNKNRSNENVMFGDEIEYTIIRNDEILKQSSLILCSSDLINEMMNLENVIECQYGSHWAPEYASYCIEGTPSMPFKLDLNSSLFVEDSMRTRRNKLKGILSAINGAIAITLPCFPNMYLYNSILMAKRLNHKCNKKKIKKNNEQPLDLSNMKIPNSNKNKQNFYELKNHINLLNKDKNFFSDTNASELEESEPIDCSRSYTTFQKSDELLLQDICYEVDEAELVELAKVVEVKQEQRTKKEIKIKENQEPDMLMSIMKDTSKFECELFKIDNINQYSKSCLISDMGINTHVRYTTLTNNIRCRRGTKIISFNSIYEDVNTKNLKQWDLSLDKNDRRLFKKIKKKNILDDHLIWNKSMTNIRAVSSDNSTCSCDSASRSNDSVNGEVSPFENKIHYSNPKYCTFCKNVAKKESNNAIELKENDEENIFDTVVKNSLFSNLDDNKDHIYVYNRDFIDEYSKKTKNPIKNYVYLDAMLFGMGMCCLQITMSFPTIENAKYIYDQLAIIAPLFLAITASTPYLGGFLVNTDTRWRVISNSVDCRTEEELSYISKPRYSGISLYISNELPLKRDYYFYNDIDVILNKNIYEKLKKENVEEYLARQISSLFVRDPLVVFKESYSDNDILSIDKKIKDYNKHNPSKKKAENASSSGCINKESDMRSIYLSDNFDFLENYEEKVLSSQQHFESIQSTNWNSVRFKQPPIIDNNFNGSNYIGWRVELRTPDIQITDFENACIVTLIMILSKFILEEKLNLYIPMSLLEENLYRSSNRDAIIKEKFYFRKDLNYDTINNEIEEKSIYDIFFNETNGIFVLCSGYVKKKFKEGLITQTAKNKIDEYIEFVKLRCNGNICTGAAYLRNFILNHPAYKKDSYINSEINYDICKLIADIGNGLIVPQELLGIFVDPYKERLKSDLRQIYESHYHKLLAYKFISGEDHTQYLLISETIKQYQDYYTRAKNTNYEESIDNTLKFGKKLYQLSA